MSLLIRGGTVLTVNSNRDILEGASLLVEKNRISALIGPADPIPNGITETVDARGKIIMPGFVQSHVHLCQTLFRGLADDLELLDWLRDKIFPLEAAHSDRSVYFSAMTGIAELIRSGTTTILDMGTVNHEEEIIRAVGETGLRAYVGKVMMDVNELYPRLRESTAESLRSTAALAGRWHNSFEERIKYAVAPRFILSCSDKLLREAYEMTGSFAGMLFHTHASENKNEIRKVRERCGMENIEYLGHLGVLAGKTCLAHCVQATDNELQIIKSTGTHVAHCPSSNLKLGSGIAAVPHMLKSGINVSLGSDGAPCNNNLNMFQEMRLASLIQKPIHGPMAMDARTVVEMATINGARALSLGEDIGSIETGKKADIVLLDLNQIHNPVDSSGNIYSAIVYSASPDNVDSVMVDGKWVYHKKEFANIDEMKIRVEAGNELRLLLRRAV